MKAFEFKPVVKVVVCSYGKVKVAENQTRPIGGKEDF